jgi:hypothetical protein
MFRVTCSGFRVRGLGFKGLGFRVHGLEAEVVDLRVQGLGLTA